MSPSLPPFFLFLVVLLERGADPLITGHVEELPLHCARSVEVVDVLLQAAPQTINQPAMDGRTPLHYASNAKVSNNFASSTFLSFSLFLFILSLYDDLTNFHFCCFCLCC